MSDLEMWIEAFKKGSYLGGCLPSNFIQYFKSCLRSCLSDNEQIMFSFNWELTPQGTEYWCDVYNDGHSLESKAVLRQLIALLDTYPTSVKEFV